MKNAEAHHLYQGTETLYYQENPWHRYYHDEVQVCSSTGVAGLLDKSGPLMAWAVNMANEVWMEAMAPGTMVDEVLLTETLSDAKRAHKQKVSKAADVGTMVHEWFEGWIIAQIDPTANVPPDLPVHRKTRSCIEQMLAWFEEHVDEFTFAERKILSIEHKFAGTSDIGFVSTQNRASVSDFKSGKSVLSKWGKESGKVYTSIRLQMSSYVGALYEEGVIVDPRETDRWVFHIPVGTGKFFAYNLADKDQTWYSDWEADYEAFLHLREVHRWVKGY